MERSLSGAAETFDIAAVHAERVVSNKADIKRRIEHLTPKLVATRSEHASAESACDDMEKELLSRYSDLQKKRADLTRLKRGRITEQQKNEIYLLSGEISKIEEPLTPLLERRRQSKNDVDVLSNEINNCKKLLKDAKMVVRIDGYSLAKQLEKQRSDIETTIHEYNQDRPSLGELRHFVHRCKAVFDSASLLLESTYIRSSVGIGVDQKFRHAHNEARLQLPIDQLLDTGLNLAVLGEAGAGKSTSLMVFAQQKLADPSTDRIVVFAPLARVIQIWEQADPKLDAETAIGSLDEGIARYLAHRGISLAPSELIREVRAHGAIFLLDGIDEAIKGAPWLLQAVENLASSYTNTQVVISSRIAGSYVESIPFLAVTLLPFSYEQRDAFVEKWFEGPKSRHVKRIKKHLKANQEISDVVRNPLLTTILCVLEEHSVPLPDTEVKLYEERLRLLTGYYDLVKGVRRIVSHRQSLETTARRLAWHLHYRSQREEHRSVLHEVARRLMHGEMRSKEIAIAVDELADPCNVLVPMTEDGKLGFGHLRHQEFLCAQELTLNRNIDIRPFLTDPWWRGALVMFAGAQSDLGWVVEEVVEEIDLASADETLMAMIDARPSSERRQLRKVIKDNIRLGEHYEGYYHHEGDLDLD